MDASGMPKPLPCTARLPQAALLRACQEVLTSKADTFLEVRGCSTSGLEPQSMG